MGFARPPGRRERTTFWSWLHPSDRRALLLVLLTVVLSSTTLIYLNSESNRLEESRRFDSWGSAGVSQPQITSRVEQGRHIVTVAVRTSLPLPDQDNRSGFDRRAAKIVWRTHPGRLDRLELTTGETVPGPPQVRTWLRTELEAAFGPRPADLDAGRPAPPAPAPAATGPYRHSTVRTLDDAGVTVQRLLRTIAADHFHQPDVRPEVGNDSVCMRDILGGILGEEETGRRERDFKMTLTLPGTGDAEARLPNLAAYLASLGLTVRSNDLNSGLPFLFFDLPDLGRMEVMTHWPDQGEDNTHKIEIGATTGCQVP